MTEFEIIGDLADDQWDLWEPIIGEDMQWHVLRPEEIPRLTRAPAN